MGAADEVHDDEGVEHGQPRRRRHVVAEAAGDLRQQHGDEHDTQQGGDAHGDRRGIRVQGAGDVDDEVLDLQHERAVGRRRVEPHRVDVLGVLLGHSRRAVAVGVEVDVDEPPLPGVAVGVAAEQRRGQEDRRRPEPEHVARGAGPSGAGADAEPRVEQEQHAGHEHGGGEHAAGLRLQGPDERDVGERVDVGQERRGEAAAHDEGGAQRAAADRRDAPGLGDPPQLTGDGEQNGARGGPQQALVHGHPSVLRSRRASGVLGVGALGCCWCDGGRGVCGSDPGGVSLPAPVGGSRLPATRRWWPRCSRYDLRATPSGKRAS